MNQLKLQTNDFSLDPVEPTGSQHPPPHKKRRLLMALLIVQLGLLLLIFPLLIIHFENEPLQLETEPKQAGQTYSYVDGLYWSLITPIALNSTTAWPQTPQGWAMVRISDVTKLLTIGVSAGLLHDTLTSQKVWGIHRSGHIRNRRSKNEAMNQPSQPSQVFIFEKQSAAPRNKYTQKIVAIVCVFIERNQGYKDVDPSDEDSPSANS